MALLEVQHISKQYPDRTIIDDISFQQELLQKVAITGESGAGKSTLLKIISGHVAPDSGVTIFSEKEYVGLRNSYIRDIKRLRICRSIMNYLITIM